MEHRPAGKGMNLKKSPGARLLIAELGVRRGVFSAGEAVMREYVMIRN